MRGKNNQLLRLAINLFKYAKYQNTFYDVNSTNDTY